MVLALFQDSTANALAAFEQSQTSGHIGVMVLRHAMFAGTAAATTFKIRAGTTSAATLTFNGVGGARRMGGVYASHLEITEIMV